MNSLMEKGSLTFGIADAAGKVHKEFELQLMTVRGEMAVNQLLITKYPDFDQMPEVDRFSLERAAMLTQMVVRIGDITDITIDLMLDLIAEDFAVISNAEFTLREKLIGSIPQSKPAKSKKSSQD